jgi:hypothetical protein
MSAKSSCIIAVGRKVFFFRRPPDFSFLLREEDVAVAAVEGPHIEGVVGLRNEKGGHCYRGDDTTIPACFDCFLPVDEAEERRGSVEVSVPAEEGVVGEGVEPWFADEGGAEEPLGLVRQEAEQDLEDGIVSQVKQWRRRRHGAVVGEAMLSFFFCKIDTVVLLFVFDKYSLIID